MRGLKKQQGLSFISLIFVLMFVGFVGFVALKVMPIYANSFTVKSALQSLAEDALMDTSVSNIYDKLSRKFQVNAINFITKENIHVSESGGKVLVEINYVEQRKVMGNLEVLATFSEQIEFDAR